MRNARGVFALHRWATAARAARPASLASSARTEVLEASGSQAPVRSSKRNALEAIGSMHARAGAASLRVRSFQSPSTQDAGHKGRAGGAKELKRCKAEAHSSQTQALRSSAKPNTKRPCRHQLLRSTCRWLRLVCKRCHPTHNACWPCAAKRAA